MNISISIPEHSRRHSGQSNNSKNRITGKRGEIEAGGFFGNSSFSTGGNLRGWGVAGVEKVLGMQCETGTKRRERGLVAKGL
jgi:hypothetical protein